jgi:putative transposase
MFKHERTILVKIFAFCLMPNHFHIGIQETTEKGIEKFIHRLCTSYSMYFNNKYLNSGTIFQGQYKSKHVNNDDYLRYLIQYIHLNPFGIEEPELLKSAKPNFLQQATKYSKNYEYSSYKEYLGVHRTQSTVLNLIIT